MEAHHTLAAEQRQLFLISIKKDIAGISQKMLVQHLNELRDCGFIDKNKSECYPLKSEYFLTERGHRIFEAISILQSIGIEMMTEDGRQDFLIGKGLL